MMRIVPRREKLPNRRHGVTVRLCYRKDLDELAFDATFGFDPTVNWPVGARVREVFCELPFKEGADVRALADQACIVMSIALQSGSTMASLAHTLGEDDLEQRPCSLLGLIVRAGMMLDAERGFAAEAELAETGHA